MTHATTASRARRPQVALRTSSASGITTNGNSRMSSVRLSAVTPHARPRSTALRMLGLRQNWYIA